MPNVGQPIMQQRMGVMPIRMGIPMQLRPGFHPGMQARWILTSSVVRLPDKHYGFADDVCCNLLISVEYFRMRLHVFYIFAVLLLVVI